MACRGWERDRAYGLQRLGMGRSHGLQRPGKGQSLRLAEARKGRQPTACTGQEKGTAYGLQKLGTGQSLKLAEAGNRAESLAAPEAACQQFRDQDSEHGIQLFYSINFIPGHRLPLSSDICSVTRMVDIVMNLLQYPYSWKTSTCSSKSLTMVIIVIFLFYFLHYQSLIQSLNNFVTGMGGRHDLSASQYLVWADKDYIVLVTPLGSVVVLYIY